ncbi:hypothetical protein EDD22DRAFT_852830 [Suillus occidentalis]|nr:hypothetical protein EDD22DRAFT_852830 [Suillus occidentalis]
MDGNDSLKQVLKKLDSDNDNDNAPPRSAELPSMQVVRGDWYLSREYVDQFLADSPADMMADEDEDNPCAGRWKNMRDEKTRKMWGVFDESRIFMSACRHGFSLLIADMVQSGEQSKYPLAVVSKLLDTFGKDLGGSKPHSAGVLWDAMHTISTTLPLLELSTDMLTDTFVNSIISPPTSRDLDLKILKGVNTFSPSPMRWRHLFVMPVSSTGDKPLPTIFNITMILKCMRTLALNVLHDTHATLPKLMAELGVTDESVFDAWLAEERNYLMSLTQEPEHETLHMEYWQRLVNLSGSRNETARRHAIENYDKDLKVVQELEVKLRITQRWVPDDQEWRDAGRLVANRKLQRALDNLEGLVVARIFELSKMNRAGTGYKLRKHIGKALQVQFSRNPAQLLTRLIAPGESVEGPGAAASAAAMCIPAKLLPVGPTMMEKGEDEVLQDLEEEEIADADGKEDSRVLEAILQVAGDA